MINHLLSLFVNINNFRKCFKRKLYTQLTTPDPLQTDHRDQSLIFVFQYYNSDCDNLNQDFPSGKAEGVSGAIVLGGKFDVLTKPNGGGVSSILTEGRYPTAPTMNIGNDRVQSIRKLK